MAPNNNFCSGKWTHCAIDEDPQKFSSNGLQLLAIVQLSQDNFILQDVVLQNNPDQPLIHGHDLICREKKNVFTATLYICKFLYI